MKIIKKHFCLVILGFLVLFPVTRANGATADVVQILLDEMWYHYDILLRTHGDHMNQSNTFKLMDQAANKIMSIYQESDNQDELSMQTAQSLILLALAAYEVNNPTLTYNALQTAKEVDPQAVKKMNKAPGIGFEQEVDLEEKVDLIQRNWLPQFKKSQARVYGFDENVIWDTLNVGIGITYLERYLREDKIFQAIEWAEDYLNSELRNGKKEITLLLPPGMYRLKTDNLDVYPAHFEVEENSPPTIFDVTPDRYFHLRVFYCRDTITTRIDTIFNEAKIDTAFLEDTSRVYQERPKRYRNYLFAEVDTTFKVVRTITVETQRVPISPKDMDIWKGDKKVLNFDRLAFGEYEFSDGKNFGISDEFKFKRFLPEDLKWDIPFEDKFSGEEIQVKSGDAFELCVDLPRKTKRVIEGEEVISQNGKGPSGPWPPFFYTTFMAAIFYIFMNTIK